MAARKSDRAAATFDYDVCLSFAGEDRAYVTRVASALKKRGIRVFYDRYEEVGLWGKDLYTHLDDVYRNAARFCVLFASKHYRKKLWTNHERQSAQARAFADHSEYLLPARFDKTEIPGLRPTVGYIDLSRCTPARFADLIVEKVGKPQRHNYLPPIPDKLYTRLQARTTRQRRQVDADAWEFLSVLRRMSDEERLVVFSVLLHGCPEELPENIHINIDLLRRYTGFTPGKLKRVLGGIQSLGVFTSLREDDETSGHLGKYEMLVVEWTNLASDFDGATLVAHEMVRGAAEGRCDTCSLEMLIRLDFSSLASVTTQPHSHE